MKTTLLVLCNETQKRLLLMWKYRFEVLAQIVTVILLYIGVSFFIGNGRFDTRALTGTLLGYIVWFYARIVINSTGSDLIVEAQSGTLEQMYMSPVLPGILLIGRMIAMLISTTIMVLIPTFGLMLLFHIQFPMRWEGILILLLTLTGLFGFSLILSGAALVFKQINALADLIQNLMLFLTGALLPVSFFPDWLAALAKTLPITQGIIVLREVMLDGQSLSSTWANGSLVWLIVHTVIYFSIGWLIFSWCEYITKKNGSLGHY